MHQASGDAAMTPATSYHRGTTQRESRHGTNLQFERGTTGRPSALTASGLNDTWVHHFPCHEPRTHIISRLHFHHADGAMLCFCFQTCCDSLGTVSGS